MAKIVEFDLVNIPVGVTSVYVRIINTLREELFAGNVNIVDDAIQVTLAESVAASSDVLVFGHNFTGANEATFKVITGHTTVKEV